MDFAEPQVDPQTGTFSVRAEMPNPNKVLLPGQFTKVKLLLDVREGAVAVPQKAVTIEKGGAYIFVMRRDSTVVKAFQLNWDLNLATIGWLSVVWLPENKL